VRSRIFCCRWSAIPSAAAIAAIDKCMSVAGDMGPRVTAMAVEEDIPGQNEGNDLDDLDNTAAAEAVAERVERAWLVKASDAAATRFGVRNEQRLSDLPRQILPVNIAVWARLKDMSIMPVKPHG